MQTSWHNRGMARVLGTVLAVSVLLNGADATAGGEGVVVLGSSDGDPRVFASSNDGGGMISLINRTGEEVVQLYADDYGNGVVGAYNRKGKGRTLESK